MSYCQRQGMWGACHAGVVETCNGTDDDCDGHVDEYTSNECDDNVQCTEDVCTAVTTGSGPFGTNCSHYTREDGVGGAAFRVPSPAGPDYPGTYINYNLCAHAVATYPFTGRTGFDREDGHSPGIDCEGMT